MKTTTLVIAALCLMAAHAHAQSGPSASPGAGDYFVYAGTYTHPNP